MTHTPHTARSIRLVIIPCTGKKLEQPAPAADLYIGATFPASVAAARKIAGDDGLVLILSAGRGILTLDTWLEPYDVKMGDPDAIDRYHLGIEITASQLRNYAGAASDVEVITMLPNAYRLAFERAAVIAFEDAASYVSVNLYAGARGIGDQRSVCRKIIEAPFCAMHGEQLALSGTCQECHADELDARADIPAAQPALDFDPPAVARRAVPSRDQFTAQRSRWSEGEDTMLTRWHVAGYPVAELAARLDRTETAIRRRCQQLNLTTKGMR
jgi:hypothetical protein